MTVKDFIAWLQTQDQDAIVCVLKQHKADAYQSYGECTFESFAPELSDYTDFRNNQFAKGQTYENDRYLYIGEKD